MLKLPNVTLVAITGVEVPLTGLAIRDCTNVATFGDSGVFDPPQNGESYEEALWYGIAVDTSHALIVQYDSWILDAARWNPAWLEYDYIGAPWPWHKDLRVGNGGFSLRSRRLMDFLAENREEYPVTVHEDDTLCRCYRPALEVLGFRWAPEDVAADFAFERSAPRPTFGFHGIFNWPKVLSKAELAERVALAGDHIRSKREWKELGF